MSSGGLSTRVSRRGDFAAFEIHILSLSINPATEQKRLRRPEGRRSFA